MANAPDYFETRAKEIKDSLTHFLLNHSSISPRMPEEIVFVSPEGDRNFADLDEVGKKMQEYLTVCYDQFFFGLQTFLKDVPKEQWDRLNKSNEVIIRIIEHGITFCETSGQALEVALAALEEQIKVLQEALEEKKRR